MNKTELFKMCEDAYPTLGKIDLYRCKADYSIKTELPNTKEYRILRSYNTVVAAYDVQKKYIYVRDYYSATTSQHIHKFWRKMIEEDGVVSLIFLYNRKDRLLARVNTQYGDVKYPDNESYSAALSDICNSL